MELWITPLFILGGVAFGVWFGSDIKKALASRRERREIEANRVIDGPNKPINEYTNYTVDELESHKRFLEKDYREQVNYPYSRAAAAEKLKKVLQMLDWHYDRDGTREFEARRARTKAELADFDRKYAAALRGN